MRLPTAKLGYLAAALTLFAAALVPFVLTGVFTTKFASMPLHVDEVYSGGPEVRTVQANGYSIHIHRPVYPHLLQTEKPFVQLDWTPVQALPQRVSDLVDIDGDGRPDILATFDVPKDPKSTLTVDVQPLSSRYQELRNARKAKFSELIARVDNTILVRIPLSPK